MNATKKVNQTILNKLANKMGFGKVKSFSTMYIGGTSNAYGKNNCSFTMFTIRLNNDNLCVGIETNSTYLKPTKQSDKLNRLCSFENPKDINELLNKL